MITLVLTTEGGSREDGNVYYAGILNVKDPHGPGNRDTILKIVRTVTGGKSEVIHSNMTHTTFDSCYAEDADDGVGTENWQERVVAALTAAGYIVDQPTLNYVIEDSGY